MKSFGDEAAEFLAKTVHEIMHSKTLDEIAIEQQTDRASVFTRTYAKPHNYAVHYDKLFAPIRDQKVKLLEIGVGGGEGVRMWLEYFQNAQVFGVDIVHDTNPWNTRGQDSDHRYVFCQIDQCSHSHWSCFLSSYGKDWGVIVDDGLHSNIAVITTFNSLWQNVKPGGFYAIEDLNVGYGGPSFFVNAAWPNQIDFLKGKMDEMNNDPNSDIDSIYLSRELAVFKKKI